MSLISFKDIEGTEFTINSNEIRVIEKGDFIGEYWIKMKGFFGSEYEISKEELVRIREEVENEFCQNRI